MNLGVIELTIMLDSGLLAINKYVTVNTSRGGAARLYTITGKLLNIMGETATDAVGKLKIYVPKDAEYSIFVRNTPRQKSFLYSKFNIIPIPIIDSIAEIPTASPVVVPTPSIDNTVESGGSTSAGSTQQTTSNGKSVKGTASSSPTDIDLTAQVLYGIPLWIKLIPDVSCCMRVEFSSDNKTSWSVEENSVYRASTYQYMPRVGELWITHIRISQISGSTNNISSWVVWH